MKDSTNYSTRLKRPNVPPNQYRTGAPWGEKDPLTNFAAFLFEKFTAKDGSVRASIIGDNKYDIDPISPKLTITLDEGVEDAISRYRLEEKDMVKALTCISDSIALTLRDKLKRSSHLYAAIDSWIEFDDAQNKFTASLIFPEHDDLDNLLEELEEHEPAILQEIEGRMRYLREIGKSSGRA
jgi:hypothetical protein